MDKTGIHLYDKKISERLQLILEYANLEVKGAAAITSKSTDIFYAVLSGRRRLSRELAAQIGEALDFDGNLIFNINIPIPSSINQSPNLQEFRAENYNNKEYFVDTWRDSKDSSFIKANLIYRDFFTELRYAWEVSDRLKELGKVINSDLLSKQLKYFVTKGILKSKKAPIKLRSDGYGSREVDVYYL